MAAKNRVSLKKMVGCFNVTYFSGNFISEGNNKSLLGCKTLGRDDLSFLIVPLFCYECCRTVRFLDDAVLFGVSRTPLRAVRDHSLALLVSLIAFIDSVLKGFSWSFQLIISLSCF
jgi:hypothetical protein